MANQNQAGLIGQSNSVLRLSDYVQAYAITALILGALVAWGWACVVGVNS